MSSSNRSDQGSGVPRSFPGGAPRLPRISGPSDSPAPQPTPREDTPLRSNPDERRPAADRGYEAYFSNESLFDSSDRARAAAAEPSGPYEMLGLTRAASWEEIAKAHRRLVSQLHPDRYVGADEVVREAAERRVRDVNEAYAKIRRERAVQRA